MKIVSLLRRKLLSGKPGTLLDNFMGSDKSYLFEPFEEHGPHVCNVTVKEHIKRFLSIDQYEVYQVSDYLKDGDDDGEGEDDLDKLAGKINNDADQDETSSEEIAEIKKEIEADRLADEEAEEIAEKEKVTRWPDILEIDTTDTDEWTVKRLSLYAEQVMEINPKSKKDIRDYAREVYDVDLPATIRSPGPLLRALIEAIKESKTKED